MQQRNEENQPKSACQFSLNPGAPQAAGGNFLARAKRTDDVHGWELGCYLIFSPPFVTSTPITSINRAVFIVK